MSTLPRPDLPEHEIRAWLHDREIEMLDALECRDLYVTTRVDVRLHGERRKKGQTAEQRADRLAAATRHSYNVPNAHIVRHTLREIAELRRRLHYALLRVEPPPTPKDEPATEPGGAA